MAMIIYQVQIRPLPLCVLHGFIIESLDYYFSKQWFCSNVKIYILDNLFTDLDPLCFRLKFMTVL